MVPDVPRAPEPVDLLLGRVRDGDTTGHPQGVHAPPAAGHATRSPAPPAGDATGDADWTFRPDEMPASSWPYAQFAPGSSPDDGHPSRRRARMAPRVGVIVVVAALVTGASAIAHIGPFHSSSHAAATRTTPTGSPTDIRGVWNVLNAYSGVLYVATMHISTENLSSGAFSGTITSPVGTETLTGTVKGTRLTFTVDLGSGAERGTAVVSGRGVKTKIDGEFSNPSGGHGTIVATRTSR